MCICVYIIKSDIYLMYCPNQMKSILLHALVDVKELHVSFAAADYFLYRACEFTILQI